MSTGRSIHAVPSITPSLREGIEDGPRLAAESPALITAYWPKTAATRSAGINPIPACATRHDKRNARAQEPALALKAASVRDARPFCAHHRSLLSSRVAERHRGSAIRKGGEKQPRSGSRALDAAAAPPGRPFCGHSVLPRQHRHLEMAVSAAKSSRHEHRDHYGAHRMHLGRACERDGS